MDEARGGSFKTARAVPSTRRKEWTGQVRCPLITKAETVERTEGINE